MMAKHECGEIAVVETEENLKPIGVITDRDIAWRVVAAGKSPGQTSVRDAMVSRLRRLHARISMIDEHYGR